ncbi:hypothetical protein HYH02_012913 [Chlamydomonas schloesseri]|uniref:Uncharacterized protein n=1 Tax=Chlamydomonas schloesseri TaxID=2026947 RepID=A0A835SVW8_9CHLO|nr:hypothetical protein HYH02_012913 [Chlamydomonas schloesseri]|eukprot:KAG2432781.1 hypothetical protein HYH02_012913 [Chlamydomonas schloesseri]
MAADRAKRNRLDAIDEKPWKRLTPELIESIASFVPVADVVTGLKLACADTAACLRDQYKVIQLANASRRTNGGDTPAQAVADWPGRAFVAHWRSPGPWRQLNLRQRQRLLCLAANSGHMASLEAALAHSDCGPTEAALAAAAAGGHMAACRRLLQEGYSLGVKAACAAAKAGQLDLVELLWSNRRFDWRPMDVALAACSGGHVHILRWLETEQDLYRIAGGRHWSELRMRLDLAAAAAEGGHVSLTNKLLERMPVRNRRLDWGAVVLWGAAPGCPMPAFRSFCERSRELERPLSNVNLVLMRAVGSRTADWREKADYVLAQRPRSLSLLSGEGKGTPGRAIMGLFGLFGDMTLVCHLASEQPDYEQRLRYIAAHLCGQRLPRVAAALAAESGDVAALRFLLDECGMQPETYIAEAAARSDQAGVLDFLRQRGQLPACCSRRGFNAAAAPASVLPAAVAALVQEATAQVAAKRVTAGDNRTFWSAAFARAAWRGTSLTVLRYLHEQLGAEVQLRPIVAGGSVEQLEWALQQLGGAAAQQDPDGLLMAALHSENLAAATHLRASGLAPDLPVLDKILALRMEDDEYVGKNAAVRWYVTQSLLIAQHQHQQQQQGEPEAGISGADWCKLLRAVGIAGRASCYSENEWEWLKGVFTAWPVPAHATAASTARGLFVGGGSDEAAAKAEAAALTAAWGVPDAAARAEWERVEGVRGVRKLLLEDVESDHEGYQSYLKERIREAEIAAGGGEPYAAEGDDTSSDSNDDDDTEDGE